MGSDNNRIHIHTPERTCTEKQVNNHKIAAKVKYGALKLYVDFTECPVIYVCVCARFDSSQFHVNRNVYDALEH